MKHGVVAGAVRRAVIVSPGTLQGRTLLLSCARISPSQRANLQLPF